MKVRIIRTVGNRAHLLHSGTVIEVRKLPQITFTPAYQVTEAGPHAGLEIPYESCVVLPDEKTYTEQQYTRVHQELLQKREEVTFLMEHKGKLESRITSDDKAYHRLFERLQRANKLNNRLAVELDAERKDKALLLQTIEKEADARKLVVLPQPVTDAIRTCLDAGMSRILIITNMEQIEKLFRDYEKPVLRALAVIRDFAWHSIGGGQDLLEALAATKVVQRTPEEQFDQGVREICERWAIEQESTPVDLAVKVVGLARSVWADKK